MKETVSVCECGDYKDQHENESGPSKLLPALGEPSCKRYRFHHKEQREVFRNEIGTMVKSFLPDDAESVMECPLCGAKQIVATDKSSYHSGTCVLSNHSLPNDVWNNFYCWKELREYMDDRDRWLAKAVRYEEALRNVMKHMEIVVTGNLNDISPTYRIAKDALEKGNK